MEYKDGHIEMMYSARENLETFREIESLCREECMSGSLARDNDHGVLSNKGNQGVNAIG
jgi:hypothetical protein